MTDRACPRETELLTAHREGTVPEALRDHERSCPACSLAVSLTGPLAILAQGPDRRLPSARLLFVKATLRREDRKRESLRRLELGLHVGVFTVTLAGLAATLTAGKVPLSMAPWVLLGLVFPAALWSPLLKTRS